MVNLATHSGAYFNNFFNKHRSAFSNSWTKYANQVSFTTNKLNSIPFCIKIVYSFVISENTNDYALQFTWNSFHLLTNSDFLIFEENKMKGDDVNLYNGQLDQKSSKSNCKIEYHVTDFVVVKVIGYCQLPMIGQ